MSDRDLRLALVTGQLGFGGAERQLTELALDLRGQGVTPHVFCLGGADEPFGSRLRTAGVGVTAIRRRGGFDLPRVFELAATLRSFRPDVVHSFLIDPNPYAFLAAKLAGAPPFVASNRNVDFVRGSVRRTIDGVVFRRAAAVVVNAEAVRRFTAHAFGLAEECLSVVYNGVDVVRFRPEDREKSDVPVVGTMGSLTAKKNPELFAAACAAVRRRFPDVRCLHAGEGPLRERIESRYPGVVELTGRAEHAEEFLAGLDVFVLTSDREGCPNVLLEAMACALPVVTSDAGGASEIVRDGETGFVVSKGDTAGLADGICALLADPDLRLRMGAAARAEVECRFTVSRMTEEMLGLYRRITGYPDTREVA